MRTRITASAQGSTESSACALEIAATASTSDPNTAANASPAVEKTYPPLPSMASRRILSWRANACAICRGWSCHRAVLPSTSVKRNVTVPLGRASATPRQYLRLRDWEQTPCSADAVQVMGVHRQDLKGPHAHSNAGDISQIGVAASRTPQQRSLRVRLLMHW
jgi:hypothetical protein